MSFVRSRRVAFTVVLGVLVLGVLAGSAWSFWSNPGTGAGGASSGTTAAVSLSPGASTPGLYPGGTTDVVLRITNPNPSAVTVETLSLDVSQGAEGFSVDADHPGCGTGVLSYLPQSDSGRGWAVPARVGAVDGVAAVTLSGALAMSPDAASACQGVTISVHLTAGT